MTDPVAFCDWLAVQGYFAPRPVGLGNWAAVRQKLFTWSIETGRIGDFISIDACFCYQNCAAAMAALQQWKEAGYAGEPEGWHRAPHTGRRRPDGDREQEHLAW